MTPSCANIKVKNFDLNVEFCESRVGLGFKSPQILENVIKIKPTLYDMRYINRGIWQNFRKSTSEALNLEDINRQRNDCVQIPFDYARLNSSYETRKITMSDELLQTYSAFELAANSSSTNDVYIPTIFLEKKISDLDSELKSRQKSFEDENSKVLAKLAALEKENDDLRKEVACRVVEINRVSATEVLSLQDKIKFLEHHIASNQFQKAPKSREGKDVVQSSVTVLRNDSSPTSTSDSFRFASSNSSSHKYKHASEPSDLHLKYMKRFWVPKKQTSSKKSKKSFPTFNQNRKPVVDTAQATRIYNLNDFVSPVSHWQPKSNFSKQTRNIKSFQDTHYVARRRLFHKKPYFSENSTMHFNGLNHSVSFAYSSRACSQNHRSSGFISDNKKWVPKPKSTNFDGPKQIWVPKIISRVLQKATAPATPVLPTRVSKAVNSVLQFDQASCLDNPLFDESHQDNNRFSLPSVTELLQFC